MKKLFTVVCAALVAAVAFADRTASRGWVSGNFAPTNLVPRVEALESVRPSDFWDDDGFLGAADNWLGKNAWSNSGFLSAADNWLGKNAWSNGYFVDDAENWLGKNAWGIYYFVDEANHWLKRHGFAADPSGSVASTSASGAVQLGEGENEHSNTLQFREWTLVGDDGKIPVERLAAASVLAVIKGMSEAQIAELKDLLK